MVCSNRRHKINLFVWLMCCGILGCVVIVYRYGPFTRHLREDRVTGPVLLFDSGSQTTRPPITVRPDSCKSCFQFEFAFKYNGDKICAASERKVKLLILISSAIQYYRLREAVRETWASVSSRNTGDIRYVFLFGSSSNATLNAMLDKESEIYGDIVVSDFIDTYRNLTLKTIVGMNWAVVHCSHAQYVMKADDDTWVNTIQITNMLSGWDLNDTLVGACMSGSPHRNTQSKWYVRKHEYPHSVYPTFCSGTGYVTSMNVTRRIVQVSRNIPFFYLEDIYVAICLRKLGHKVKSATGFNLGFTTPSACNYKSKSVITSHHMTPELLRKIWTEKCPA